MIRGQLSEMQRDENWRGTDPATRAAASLLPDGDDPSSPTPEQIAFRKRIEQEKELDENFGRAGIAQDVGKITNSAGAARSEGPGSEKEREKKRRQEMERAARYAQMLENEMDRISGQINANDEVLNLLRAGRLDRDNPDHIDLIIAAGLDPNLNDDDLLASAIDNGRSLRDDYDNVASAHRRATNPQSDAERDQVLEEVQRWQAEGEPQQAFHLIANLDDGEMIRDINQADGLSAEEQELSMDAFEGDAFGGGFGEYESFADQVDPDGAVQEDAPEDTSTGAPPDPANQRDFSNDGGAGPSGMGG